ncbi:MAG: hydantoinase/oxoprolinase family protein [Devosia nanyangense]|uniref:Hydantoinase/oxoprolinase family protein n=1 Tax=Devosia nanyangense TaxID=1228055 RepID=A0A933L3Z3_9HYPH|nr:hydantoinase/oxoprolinase family protein [Devosia nanyangense]
MIRIGVDVGGTNTDAVVLNGAEVIAGAKRPTTADVHSGVKAAVAAAMETSAIAAAQVDAVMVGTTHFVNALVERRRLAPTGLIRLCLPSGGSLKPFADWPADLIAAMHLDYRLADGGCEMDGREIAPLNPAQILAAVRELRAGGCTELAISAVFATIRGDAEREAAALIAKEFPDMAITLSQDIGRIGLLERENAATINAALRPLAREVVDAFGSIRAALGLNCPLFFTANDGTLIDSADVAHLPVLTFACGPTNSMRGAAYLSGVKHALVIDVGGTTTDVGEVRDGFPRLAGTSVEVVDVRTNFSMPDVISVGLGGGSLVKTAVPAVGPESVGRELITKGIVFGGDVLTASDIVVAAGRAKMGSHPPPEVAGLDGYTRFIDQIVTDAVARSRTSGEAMPVLAVGGGSVMLADRVDGLEVIRPPHFDLANAVGAAIAQISGEVSKIVPVSAGLTREEAIEQVTEEARAIAIGRGADPASLLVLSKSDVPLSYLPGNNLSISVTVVGDLKLEAR